MKARKLDLPSGRWRFIIDRDVTKVWSPRGQRFLIPDEFVAKVSTCGCGPEFSCFGWAITPGTIRDYIENVILAEQDSDATSRLQEKAASRAADEAALATGEKSREDLRRENGAFAFPPSRVSLSFSGRKF